LPWSTWPIVPMLQCGLVLSNFSFAILVHLFFPEGYCFLINNQKAEEALPIGRDHKYRKV